MYHQDGGAYIEVRGPLYGVSALTWFPDVELRLSSLCQHLHTLSYLAGPQFKFYFRCVVHILKLISSLLETKIPISLM